MELKKGNKLGKYQYKRVAFEITDATSFADIAYIFEQYPELIDIFCDDSDKTEPIYKSKGKTKRIKSKRP